jgi:hypothetical protein
MIGELGVSGLLMWLHGEMENIRKKNVFMAEITVRSHSG